MQTSHRRHRRERTVPSIPAAANATIVKVGGVLEHNASAPQRSSAVVRELNLSEFLWQHLLQRSFELYIAYLWFGSRATL